MTKRLLLFCSCLSFIWQFSVAQNRTNLRTLNAGANVVKDQQENSWQFSIGEQFVVPLVGQNVALTQGFNQPDGLGKTELLVYQDSIGFNSKVNSLQTTAVVVGVDSSAKFIWKDFVLKNQSALRELSIDSIRFKNGFFTVNRTSFKIKKDQLDSLRISLIETIEGKYTDTIFIYSNSTVNNPFFFPVVAQISKVPFPEIVVYEKDTLGAKIKNGSQLSFGVLEINHDSTKTIIIKNNGVGNLLLKNISVDNLNFNVIGFVPTTLAQHEIFTFKIQLRGTNSGQFLGKLLLVSNDLIEDSLFLNLKGEVLNTTTWNGTSWSNGLPDSTKIVRIWNDYAAGGFTAKQLEVKAGVTVSIHDNSTRILVKDSVINLGTISKWCLNVTDFTNQLTGNAVVVEQPKISSLGLLEAVFESQYVDSFSVSQLNTPEWYISGLPLGLKSTKNKIEGSAVELGTFNLKISALQGNCSATDSVDLVVTDLTNPKLYIPSVFTVKCNLPKFRLSPLTDSKGSITYELQTPNPCVVLNTTTGDVEILCGDFDGPLSINIKQARTTKYRSASASTLLVFEKEKPVLKLLQTTFDIYSNDSIIPYETNSSSKPTFTLLGESSNAIVLKSNGIMQLLQIGTVPVIVDLPESSCFQRVRDTVYLEIVNDPKPPVAGNDTVYFYLYQSDITINLYQNDYGVTALLDSSKLDLQIKDAVYDKYLEVPGVGLFIESKETPGVIVFKPKSTFIGTYQFDYSITDKEGLVGYGHIIITVLTKDEIPKLEYKELYTPNGDGKNDIFIIGYLNEDDPGNLTVIDRLGNQVYYRARYRNEWDFTLDNGRMVDDGAYFFVYKENGREKLQGAFEIRRK